MNIVVSEERTLQSGTVTVQLVDDLVRTELVDEPVLSDGDCLGKYRIVRKIGRGGMADIYEAHDTLVGRRVALKVLRPRLAELADNRRRFEQEAMVLATLNHPNIVMIHDFGQERGLRYMALELLRGETLRQRLERAALFRREVVHYARQLAEGLAAAHERGIVHRDLKPENIFITKADRIKILDFGLSKHTAPFEIPCDPDSGMLIGTLAYMSPEQLRCEPTDHRTDIFTFGTILLEMLTGKNPFRHESPTNTIAAILNEDSIPSGQFISLASRRLETISRLCVEKNPARRLQALHWIRAALSHP